MITYRNRKRCTLAIKTEGNRVSAMLLCRANTSTGRFGVGTRPSTSTVN